MMLAGLTLPFASAEEVTITFLNPLAELEPINDMPIASRVPLRAKLEAGEPVSLLALTYGKGGNPEMVIGLTDLVRDKLIEMYPQMAGKITIATASGHTALNNVLPQGTATNNLIATDNNSPFYWKNQGPVSQETGMPASRVPFLGNPWGAKTDVGMSGYPSYEEPFERYAQWASFDAVIFGIAD